MTFSPPLDGAVGFFVFFAYAYGAVAFLGATIVEIIVLWRLGWGPFLDSVTTSFAMNMASTLVGLLMAFALNINLTFGIFLLMFIISIGIEGGILLGMNESRHGVKKVWRLAVIANVISYILLGIGWFIFLEV